MHGPFSWIADSEAGKLEHYSDVIGSQRPRRFVYILSRSRDLRDLKTGFGFDDNIYRTSK
jgi:hypothetical protein